MTAEQNVHLPQGRPIMRKSIPRVLRLAAPAVAFVMVAAFSAEAGAAGSDDPLWTGAEARIEKHRKADAVIRVVDAAGKPVPGARVKVEQTRHEFLFGCNIFLWGNDESSRSRGIGREAQADYRRRFAELFNYATLPFYWPSYERRRGEPRYDYTEQVARWCREHGIACKGHPLAWNYADAAWWPDDPAELRRLQMRRIDDCVARFAGLIDRWDVVNEATHFDREEFVKRAPKHTGMWKQTGQIEFTRECFEHARKANPEATLLINDYRTDPAYERVIEQLVDKDGKPLYDVIGIQSHQHGGTWPNTRIWEVCERFSRFGVPLHFTETTILSGQRGFQAPPGGQWPSTPEGEAWQAKEVVRFYTMLFSHPAVEAITWWDLADFHAWKQAPAGFLRRDMTPKPSYEELMKLIKGKWWTAAEVSTADDGTARLRGFRGDYAVTVEAPGREPAKSRFTLKKGADNAWTVTVR
jgi:endo-1,4-beta-xylanase